SDDAVVAELAAQGGAVDAQHGRGAALVALAVVQHFHEQGNLQLAQGDAVEILRIAAVEVADVAAHGGGHVIAQRRPRRAAACGSLVSAAFNRTPDAWRAKRATGIES